jgi:predicted PurR-regulated permease PerM
MADLIGPFKQFQQEAVATRVAVEERLRVLRRIVAWLIAFVAVTTVLVALVLIILVQNRQTNDKTRAVIKTNADLSAVIADCTTVGGTCYEKNQQRLRTSIMQLTQANEAIAKCARSTDTDAEMDRCVSAKTGQPTAKTGQPAGR